jgi:hypothetical protein
MRNTKKWPKVVVRLGKGKFTEGLINTLKKHSWV